MKKPNKLVLIIIVSVILVVGLIFGIYKIFKDENSLTIMEKTWINNNKNSVYTINVLNDVNIFGKNGNGVFFDFVNNLDEDLELKLNSAVYSVSNGNDSFGFNVGTSYDKRDLLLYTDYYVLVSSNNNSVVDLKNIKESTVGILSQDLSYISNYYELYNTIKTYENSEGLFKALDGNEVSYIIIPENLYKDVIISKYNINYFFNDAKVFYYLHLGNDDTLNSIVTKYYNNWIKDSFKDSYNRNNYELFLNSLNISDVDVDKLTDKTYTFEYTIYQPYELLSRGNFSGIINEYLESFKEFSTVDISYNKVRDFNNLKYDIDKNKIDIFFGNYNYYSNYNKVNINLSIDYYLIGKRDIRVNVDSLKSYNDTVYVQENSVLYDYLSTYNNITLKTYKSLRELKRLIRKGNVIIVDKLYYDRYLIDNLDNTEILLSDKVKDRSYYIYISNNNAVFNKLFSTYLNSLNPKEVTVSGINKYYETYKAGSRVVILAKYIIMLICVIIISVLVLVRHKKKIVLNTKVKNNEKIRYVDMLTSLKNRNYLNDRLDVWNQNTVYPQAVIVLDLNNIKYLNDTFGHEEGDKQIKAAANFLFKTQLENTELIRTDGNEFMVYLVGYSEKQIVSYIKKLLKEFKKLPYEYGVAIGFSMIFDDKKLIEDAFNEATIQMRENKNSFGESNEK